MNEVSNNQFFLSIHTVIRQLTLLPCMLSLASPLTHLLLPNKVGSKFKILSMNRPYCKSHDHRQYNKQMIYLVTVSY